MPSLTFAYVSLLCIGLISAQIEESGSGDEGEDGTTVEVFPGTDAIYLTFNKPHATAIRNSYSTDATRTYSIEITGISSHTAADVAYLLISGLDPGTSYTVVVGVLDDGVNISSATLHVTTVTFCDLSCTNARCIVFSSASSRCVCEPGYRPNSLQAVVCVDVDECQTIPSPCPLNSTCSNTDGSFTCRCPTGYRFEERQCVVYDICKRGPCENGGTCSSADGNYECSCPSFYYGLRCENYINPCTTYPCRNGGYCIDQERDYRCLCPSNYEGKNCDKDVDECVRNISSCDPNSICKNTIGSYECHCKDGYRGNGRVKCYLIRLLPYGSVELDTLLHVWDDAASPTIRASFGIPFGFKTFRDMRVTSNGLVSLGPNSWSVGYLYRPPYNGFYYQDIALIAPFWDDFHPSGWNNGRVYYQVYDKGSVTLTRRSEAVVQEVGNRINEHYRRDDFEPLFVLKATWSEVVMYPEYYNRGYPSTFQAIIASDGTDTYLIYNYKEDAMLWDTRKRYYWGNRALIGYSFAAGQECVEVQGDYRPDHRSQNAGGPPGQYYYHVAKGVTNEQRAAARTGCLKWAFRELRDPWWPSYEPCPCTSLQARIDRSFTFSVDVELYWNEYYDRYWPGYYRTASLKEWAYEEVGRYNCYQPRFNTGPRCCFAPRSTRFSWFWGWWSQAPLLSGPFSSRYERHQIPIFERNPWWSWVSVRNRELFELQFNRSMESDLIPRRHCCVESEDPLLCSFYQLLRPPATCIGYVPRFFSFFWGDPHITTSDGVTYSFNGLGEYYMVYAPGVFVLQARTKKAKKEDMTDSDATVFVAFVAKDLSSNTSGTVQFEVDFDSATGNEVIVKVDGNVQSNISDTNTDVSEVSLSVSNGSYSATFPSSPSITVTANNFLLTVQFTGDPSTMQNYSRGLLGYWDGIKENDFLLRNGSTLDWELLQPTNNLDILNGTLNERLVYPFGQSWKLQSETESYFTYTGAPGDTFEDHNPTSAPEPPFLEDLVADQRGSSLFEEIRANCTTNGILSTPCLYDVLTTNRSEIGDNTMAESESSAEISATNANALPVITLPFSPNIDLLNGTYTFMAKINEETTFAVNATDADGDEVSFSLEMANSIEGITIHNTWGMVSWTPTTANLITNSTNMTLEVIATDALGGESILRINVKLCPCLNNGTCLYDEPVLGTENYQVVNCNCTDAYSGADCSEDRNGCLLSACFSNVTCTDVTAPGFGEICGDCPAGTTGDGRNCTNIDMCDSDPCEQKCESLYNNFTCSCYDGYVLTNRTHCRDVDECALGAPCNAIPNTLCKNTEGNYSCECLPGFKSALNASDGKCEDIDECTAGSHNCSLNTTQCFNFVGSFACTCLEYFDRDPASSDKAPCVDLDECAKGLDNCDSHTEDCINEIPSFRCTCKSGLTRKAGACVDIKECSNPSLNSCDKAKSLCAEEEGGYRCTCFTGYESGTDNKICKDIDECKDDKSCPPGSDCLNKDGSYECRCRDGVECPLDPKLDPLLILQLSPDSVTAIVDIDASYHQYEVKAVGEDGVKIETRTTETFASVNGLNPNTKYDLSVRVRKLKGYNYIIPASRFSDPVSVTTGSVDLAFAVTLKKETYNNDLANITSAQSLLLRDKYEKQLKESLKSTVGDQTLSFSNVALVAFRRGSVDSSGVGSLNTKNASHGTASINGSSLSSESFGNFAQLTIPQTPQDLIVANISTNSILFEFSPVSNSVNYEVAVTCPRLMTTVTVDSPSAVVEGLTPNDICSGRVRVLANAGSNRVAYSAYSDPAVTSTSPAVLLLNISDITENSLVITFASVARATSYHVTAETVASVHLLPSNASNGILNVTILDLAQATNYVFTVTVVTNDASGKQRNGSARTEATTYGFCDLNPTYCQNGATCNHTITENPTCLCASGYYGERCEKSQVGGGSNNAWKIGVGVAGGVLLFALIAVAFVSYKKKVKVGHSNDI